VSQQPPATPAQIAELLHVVASDWRPARTWLLPGASAAQVTAIDVEEAGGRRRTLVLRQYGAANLLADPHAAQTEYRLLSLLSGAGLPVPKPYYADESGSFVPGPCLLQDFIHGDRVDEPSDLVEFTRQLATTLAAVHSAGIARAEVAFLTDVRDTVANNLGTGSAHPNELLSETAVRASLTKRWPPAELNEPVVLHGDFWPGNVLWRDGKVVGVIDWEDAQFGDPLADLAITRQELFWFLGADAADLFTDEYLAERRTVDATMLPVWDLRAALRATAFPLESWGMPAAQVASMRAALREFIASAFTRLASGDSAHDKDTA